MAKWKLSRLSFGSEVFTFSEGDEVTIGRGLNNKIVLSSLLISRNHCVLSAKRDEVFVTDLKSSNGIYIGEQKIQSNTPKKLKALDIIGFGLTSGSTFPNVDNNEKYIFKLIKEEESKPLVDRIIFQNEDALEEELKALEDGSSNIKRETISPVLYLKQNLKRKINQEKENVTNDFMGAVEKNDNESKVKGSIFHSKTKSVSSLKKFKEDVNPQNSEDANNKDDINLELDAFDIKREYLGYDDDPIEIDSESDSDGEWVKRLSQNSPGKPLIRTPLKSPKNVVNDFSKDDNSYSQMDDEFENDIIKFPEVYNEDEEYDFDDLISIPPPPPNFENEIDNDQRQVTDGDKMDNINLITSEDEPMQEPTASKDKVDGYTSVTNDIIHINKSMKESSIIRDKEPSAETKSRAIHIKDDAVCNTETITESFTSTVANKQRKSSLSLKSPPPTIKARSPPPVAHRISKINSLERKTKTSSKKDKKTSSSKRTISHLQKEERKRKLKEIAERNREQSNLECTLTDDSKKAVCSVNVKVTNTNRAMKMAESPPRAQKESETKADAAKQESDERKSKKEIQLDKSNKSESKSKKETHHDKVVRSGSKSKKDIGDVKGTQAEAKPKKIIEIDIVKNFETSSKDKKSKLKYELSKIPIEKVPVKSLKPLTGSEESLSGKPLSKVEPLPPRKSKKTVRFSEAVPEVRLFEIEPGNRMKKTSLIKTTLVDVQHMPMFSLEKLTLMKVLRWNPNWLDEQMKNDHPPPILGHDNKPTTLYHTFHNLDHYIQQVGDLLLMEIWESLSIAYGKVRNQNTFLSMRIASLPPVPPPDKCLDIFNISVDISLPNTELKTLPKVGDVLLVRFGPEGARKFFFVHNVRCLPSPPRNIHSFYNMSLHATFTQKMQFMKPGEVISGVNLGHINKELNMFEAMAYMACSPLGEAILRPEPRHFVQNESGLKIKSSWTMTLNESQQRAVSSSVAAALGDRPCIQMIQGPPGTGKSSVISSIVMAYFYNENGQRHQNRGKILICATSNAAVDGLVLKLLKIRQTLPKPQRFRMVRVGRLESMHERARDLSSQELAKRDALRPPAPAADHNVDEEISLLNAKINKWHTAARDAKDPVRVAYCEGKAKDLEKRKALLLGGGVVAGESLRPEQLALAERRIVEGADIIATTLASVHNHKMRGLKRRIALCIVDEAGQAIEPEALLPLTLDVTRLTLVGDPQQLPGYICSQRAKQLGLGESLFSRLSSCAEAWPRAAEERAVLLLQTQYRMHAHIADYPNRAFYGARVADRPPQRPALPCAPYAVLGIASGDRGQAARGENEMEAWGVVRLAATLSAALRRAGLPPHVAVITPYQAQRDAIKRKLRSLLDTAEGEACAVEVNTVDSFQGQERDVVIVSLARSHGLGFVADAGRMNVLLTRARHALFVCLNPLAVQKNPQWRTLLEDAQRRNLYRALPNQMCQPAARISDDDILSYISNQTNSHRSHR